ncbi:MAG: T9SS type A sorting domain-containing protein, partial [Paludibacter sp.]|nr:T9SS type A sorting domain-containing protein [Paludibacter sp.]
FSSREIELSGKVAVAQRVANLQLYNAAIETGILMTPQTITFPIVAKKLITDASFALSATASSGLPVTYMFISGPATLSGNTVTLTGQPGVVTISANQSGNSSYTPAQEVIRSIWVNDPAASSVSSTSQDYVDSWIATDALNRTVTTYAEAGAKKTNKVVGVFYYTWLGAHGDKVWNIPDILKQYPSDPLSPSNPGWGPMNLFHFWGEPEHGYYRSEDPWVIRRDLQMLSNAKVDFIYIDASNGYTYFETVKTLCKVSMQMRKEGIYTPQIMFFSYANSGQVMNDLYDQFYANSLYEDLWFKWDGKPVILGVSTDEVLRPEVKNYFNIKLGWAWTNTPAESNHWQWLDSYPQDYGWSINSTTPEQICVSVASHPNNSQGNSYSNGTQPAVNSDYLTAYTGRGLYFAEQWERALAVNPPVIMVTQWNEWVAQRFLQPANGTYAGRPSITGNTHFVDVFTEEFNRDMAPMKGGHTDNYYYQLISNIRKYKGMAAPQVYSTLATKTIDGNFNEWSTVTPVYQDPMGDVMHRNFAGYDPTVTYTNTTGRNDILESRATYDDNNLYFYVKTVANITVYTDPNWMLLFIDTDRNKATGWEGYDYVVNLGVTSSTQSTLKKWNGSSWTNPVTIPYNLTGNQMELSIPRTAIGLSTQFYFHWADNPQQLNDITSFFTDGESAPDRRFNYDFTAPEGIVNGCFESPVTTTYQYGPFTNIWTFDGLSGIQRNGSAWTTINAPEGLQTAFIQQTGIITQNVNFNAGSYKVGFYAAQRPSDQAPQTLKVYYDETLIATITPASSSVWTYYTTNAFTSTGGNHIVKFVGQATVDLSAFIDAVNILMQNAAINNTGFETPVTSGITMGLLTSGWTFDGLSGVQKNGSAFGAPTAPDGIQTAVIQGSGSFYQDFTFAAGSYKITFYAAYRPINTNTQSINVYCDDVLIGIIVPTSSASYGYYSTNSFTVSAGSHRINFAGVLSTDNSTFIDDVNLVLGGFKAPKLLTRLETLDKEIKIYPNPAKNQISINSEQIEVDGIKILDLQGRIVFAKNEIFKGTKTIDISLEKGIYFIKLTGEGTFATKKIMIQ